MAQRPSPHRSRREVDGPLPAPVQQPSHQPPSQPLHIASPRRFAEQLPAQPQPQPQVQRPRFTPLPSLSYTHNTHAQSQGFSSPPPPYSTRKPSSAYSEHGSRQRNYIDEERRPLLSSPPPKSTSNASIRKAAVLVAIVAIWSIAYFAYSLIFVPSQVALYKNLYDDARAQVDHLVKERATLMNEIDNLRGRLSNAKVEAFWEIARTMDTNMYVCTYPFALRLQIRSGMSGWEQTTQVVDPSSGPTGSRTANITTLRSPPPKSLSRWGEPLLSLLMNDV